MLRGKRKLLLAPLILFIIIIGICIYAFINTRPISSSSSKVTLSKPCSFDGCSTSNNVVTFTKPGTYTVNYKVTYKDIEIGIVQKTFIVKEK